MTIEERVEQFDLLPTTENARAAVEGVVIYGVPLNEEEIAALHSAIAREHPDYDAARLMSKEAYAEEQRLGDQGALLEAGSSWSGGSLMAIWEMLERGQR